MLNKVAVGLLALIIGLSGLSCAVPPTDDGGNGGGGSGGGDGGGGGVVVETFVGALTVTSSHTLSAAEELNLLSGAALLNAVDNDTVGDDNVETKTVGDCVVTTITVDLSGSADDAATVDPLDAGLSGVLSTSTAMATLERQFEGLYAANDLADAGFTAGETYTFTFEGGTDIAGFMTSIDLPALLTSTTPDLSDDALTVDTTAALDVAWAPSGTAEGVTVMVATADISTFVTIVCSVDDNGSTTVPEEAMACLLDQPTSVTVSIMRNNTALIEVDLVDGGTGTLLVSAQTGDSRTIFVSPTTGGADPCATIQLQCPEGTTCNPATFLCE